MRSSGSLTRMERPLARRGSSFPAHIDETIAVPAPWSPEPHPQRQRGSARSTWPSPHGATLLARRCSRHRPSRERASLRTSFGDFGRDRRSSADTTLRASQVNHRTVRNIPTRPATSHECRTTVVSTQFTSSLLRSPRAMFARFMTSMAGPTPVIPAGRNNLAVHRLSCSARFVSASGKDPRRERWSAFARERIVGLRSER